ncbi:unnamed protein product [Leptidea sinapis]|uniref:Uncharacterized protein n=1 Tax=Leptidea sinapis TaxID=189913 RepID=A0A5E4Q4G6_9NEOP|nr:unnamed protein product [Leptidea sinapis]
MPSSPQAVFFLDFKAACNSTIWEDDIHLKGNQRPSIHKIKLMKRIPLSYQDHSAANCLSQL